MELGLGTIVVALLVVWYLGSSINKILSGAGELSEKEFAGFKVEQGLRLHKNRIKQTKELNKIVGDDAYTNKEFEDIFNGLNNHEEEVEKTTTKK